RAFVDKKGTLFVLYRSASEVIHRDMYLLASADKSSSFQGERIHPWEVGTCPMSSMAFTESSTNTVAAWETDGQVYWSPIVPHAKKRFSPIAAPGNAQGRKHPVVAGNVAGEIILVWTEGMGWNRGGSLAWQVFDKAGKPTEVRGRAGGVPMWSLVSVFV